MHGYIHMKIAYECTGTCTHKHAYVHTHTHGRCLMNYFDLMYHLNAFANRSWGGSASTLFPGSASLLTTANTLRNARAVASVHGGQCYNVIFARENTTFIEVRVRAVLSCAALSCGLYALHARSQRSCRKLT
jgi:hypothetical protein